jgi:methylglutaconyl-CoA hydratase
MTEGSVDVLTEGNVATIEFFHPQSNSLPGVLLQSLAQAIEAAGNDNRVRVIILKSKGEKTFCAGASFDELISIDSIEKGQKFFSGFAMVINAIRKTPKFVIARVQGKAVGGGVGIACAADYALAHESASVKLSELAVGIGPFVVGPAVERKIGTGAFTQLTINATVWQSAQWATHHGMYASVHQSLDELDQELNKLVQQLAASNPEAMAQLKKIFWKGTDHWDDLLAERAAMSGQLVLSDFTRNAIQKFKTKTS